MQGYVLRPNVHKIGHKSFSETFFPADLLVATGTGLHYIQNESWISIAPAINSELVSQFTV